ncbi:MAG: hypothetical protein K0S57_2630 [Ramlibacter sp.]|jgi:hypothetical protein|nr:hypothetical protein [Ramlibacter sp.]
MKSATHYDPDAAPDPKEWLALDEHERIRLAKNYHQAARIKLPDAKAHAIFHAAVENQIAQGYGPSCRALERLQQEGLSRHDAIHAIGSVGAKFAFDTLHTPDGKSAGDTQRELSAEINALSAAACLRGKQ